MITKITDHVDRALARLIGQFRHSASHRGLLASYIAEVQEVENALFDILVQSSIADATGAQLDGLGQILGERRNGREDDVYRQAVAARFFLNKASGTIEEVLQLFRLITDASPYLDEYFPAAFVLRLEDVPIEDPANLALMLRAVKVAAVRAVLHYLAAPRAESLILGTLVSPSTTLISSMGTDSDEAFVSSVSQFSIGDFVTIGYGLPTAETLQIASIDAVPEPLLTLQIQTAHSHTAGEIIQNATARVPVSMGGLTLDGVVSTGSAGKLAGVV
jgi:hypothetical protein